MCERDGKFVVPKKPSAKIKRRWVGLVTATRGKLYEVNILHTEDPRYVGELVTHCLPEELIEFGSEEAAMNHLSGK
ncbi:MAG: hypothetical protein A2581_01785 [Candidatus Staskawiczbacteria bacterium RIFOXYD1_FULL_37_110]|nr:MAG: hypothetical protein A2581_01785 [Candidatus Staskawiczbacteria bacterium RIFOXYD1_FULL_37_110]